VQGENSWPGPGYNKNGLIGGKMSAFAAVDGNCHSIITVCAKSAKILEWSLEDRMSKKFVFDEKASLEINAARKETLDWLLPSLMRDYGVQTALDVGCGVGYFSDYLCGLGFNTVAFGVRSGNIEEARKRFPEVEFHVSDIEAEEFPLRRDFDVVLCYGLLYHLENPFRAIRNLYALTGKVAVIETRITPGTSPVATLVREGQGEDQSLNSIALIPSELCLTMMLYHAGFGYVYRPVELPRYRDFQETDARARMRTIMVASKPRVDYVTLKHVPRPSTPIEGDLWGKTAGVIPRARRKLVTRLFEIKRSIR
jgi:SAM-dependent methyltransferase